MIADSQHTQRAHAEADPVRRVTGQRNRLDGERADPVSDARSEHAVDSRRACDLELVLSGPTRDQLGRRATRDRLGGERSHGRNRIRKRSDPADVIPVGVRREDVGDANAQLFRPLCEHSHFLAADARVDRDSLTVDREQQ